jgi:hypothetical protein
MVLFSKADMNIARQKKARTLPRRLVNDGAGNARLPGGSKDV